MSQVTSPFGIARAADPYNERSIRGAFRRDQQRRGLLPRTVLERDKVLDALALWARAPLMAVQRDDIERWLDVLHIGPRARTCYISTLHNFYQWAVAEGFRKDDPTVRIVRPRMPRLVPRPIDDESLELALAVAPPRMKAWLCLAAFQGFRCKEIAQLRREDILDQRDPPTLLIHNGKGGHQAVLPLNPGVMSALRVHGLPRRGYLFLSRDDRPFPARTVSVYANRYLHDLGIDATMHQLRHWFGTQVWSVTKDMRVTQELLRHASPATTAIYSAYDKELAAQAIAHLHERPLRRQQNPASS